MRKIKARGSGAIRRKIGEKTPYERTLIVCEGEKTEPHYLCGLRDRLRLNSSQIEVTGNCNSDPLGVVNFAIKRWSKDRSIDRVYCVIDRDGHANYVKAVEAARKEGVNIISSNPCFEYWILLHFERSQKSYSSSGVSSPCSALILDLKIHLPNYEKGRREVFSEILKDTHKAIKNAVEVEKDNRLIGSVCPATNVQELVLYFIECKKKQCEFEGVFPKCPGSGCDLEKLSEHCVSCKLAKC